MCDVLSACDISSEKIALVKAMLKHCGHEHRTNDLFGQQKSAYEAIKERVKSEIHGVENIFTQHKPFLNRVIVELIQGQLKENSYPILGGGLAKGGGASRIKDVIVLVVGGATYEEVYNVHKMNTHPAEFMLPPGVRIVIGGTTIHNSKTFLKEIAKVRDLSNANY